MIRIHRSVPIAALIICSGLLWASSASAFGPLSSFGAFGQAGGEIENARGIAVAADGTSYVANSGNFRVDVFSASGAFLRAFGKDVNPGGGDICTPASGCQQGLDGEEAGAINSPQGVAIGAEGNVFVADRKNKRIDVFSPAGVFLRAFGKGVNPGGGDVCTTECEPGDGLAGAGDMSDPRGIAADSSGAIYVSDYQRQRIDVFSPDGTFLRAFGKGVNDAPGGDPDICTTACKQGEADGSAGAMRLPLDVAVVPGNQIAVANTANNRIDIFSAAGTFIRGFGKGAIDGGTVFQVCTTATGCKEGETGVEAGALWEPSGVRADAAGNLYVAESPNHRVSEFTVDGTFIRAFGAGVVNGAEAFQICTPASGCQKGLEATIPGATPEPFGLALDCRGALYVAENAGGFSRIERFGEPGTAVPPCVEATKQLVPISSLVKRLRVKVKLNRKRGTATLIVKVPDAGVLRLRGKDIAKAKRAAKRPGTLRVPVRSKGKTKRKLFKTGKAKVRAKLAFKSADGTRYSKSVSFTLRKQLRR